MCAFVRMIFVLCLLLISLWASWATLQKANFAYLTWYEWLNFSAHVEKYVPQNRQGRKDYPTKNKQLHFKHFVAINHAVHHQGQGLEKIVYGKNKRLLTKVEIEHFGAVSELIDKGYLLGKISLGLGVLLFVFLLMKSETLRLKSTVLFLSVTFFASIIVVFSVGELTVYIWLHEIFFLDNHQYHFYYQDSLMTLFMNVPEYFGAICVMLVIVWLFYLAMMLWIVDWVLLHRKSLRDTMNA